jgi:hypothetical protein
MGRVQNAFVPKACKDGRNGWFADLAPLACAVLGNQIDKCLQLFDHHDLEQLLSGVQEMLAEAVVDPAAHRFELGLQELGHAREAAAASGSCLGAGFQLAKSRDLLLAYGCTDFALADVIA